MSKKLTPEEMGKNLEDFVEDAKLLEEARGLGLQTKGEVAEGLASSRHDAARAREMGRRAAEAFAKSETEAKLNADPEANAKAPANGGPVRAPPAKVVPLGRRGIYRWAIPGAIAASFAAFVSFEGSAVLAWLGAGGNDLVGSGRDAGASPDFARELRELAREDYRRGLFASCLTRLDAAKSLDPQGDGVPDVQGLRRKAEAGLAGEGGSER